jgi:cholesterol oxidase
VRRYSSDYIVIGSGFGGSVSALRLAQKGYSVGVLEAGRRYGDDDLPKSAWDLRRYWWAPRLGLRGIFRLTIFKDVAIVSGAGVGGGSLVYANTLYRAPARFYEDAQWRDLRRLGGRARAALRRGGADARRRRLRPGRRGR